jgi:hypothetical protein
MMFHVLGARSRAVGGADLMCTSRTQGQMRCETIYAILVISAASTD